MGRLAKHRKLKDVSMRDKRDATKDLPVSDNATEKLPKKLRQVLYLRRKAEELLQNNGEKAPAVEQAVEARPSVPAPDLKSIKEQQPGESLRAFRRRVDIQTRELLLETRKREHTEKPMRPSRKAHLKKRSERAKEKKAKKRQKSALSSTKEDVRQAQHDVVWSELEVKYGRSKKDSESDSKARRGAAAAPIRDFDDLRDEVKFGEVVDRPPQLNIKRQRSEPATKDTLKSLLQKHTSSSNATELQEASKKAEQAYRMLKQLKQVRAQHKSGDA